jgi:hypothetical protein
MIMIIEGRCHCGNIAFTLDWPGEGDIAARACGCTFCTKHGGVWTSHPRGALELKVSDRDLVSPYLFGTKSATFHVCARCGVVPVVTSEIEGNTYAVVNVNTFENVPAEKLKKSGTDFEGEEKGARLARRVRNWIPKVVLPREA